MNNEELREKYAKKYSETHREVLISDAAWLEIISTILPEDRFIDNNGGLVLHSSSGHTLHIKTLGKVQ